jgi:hypothetical protein
MFQRKMIQKMAAAVFVVALAGVWQSASAFTPGACRQDGEKLCPGVTSDKELIPCLKTHQAELSNDCKVNLAELRQTVREVKEACDPDVQKFCANVQPGQGRIRRCLRAHEAELSAGCKSEVAAARKKYKITPPPAAGEVPSSGTK